MSEGRKDILIRGIDDRLWTKARQKAIGDKININRVALELLTEQLRLWLKGEIQIPTPKEGK